MNRFNKRTPHDFERFGDMSASFEGDPTSLPAGEGVEVSRGDLKRNLEIANHGLGARTTHERPQ